MHWNCSTKASCCCTTENQACTSLQDYSSVHNPRGTSVQPTSGDDQGMIWPCILPCSAPERHSMENTPWCTRGGERSDTCWPRLIITHSQRCWEGRFSTSARAEASRCRDTRFVPFPLPPMSGVQLTIYQVLSIRQRRGFGLLVVELLEPATNAMRYTARLYRIHTISGQSPSMNSLCDSFP